MNHDRARDGAPTRLGRGRKKYRRPAGSVVALRTPTSHDTENTASTANTADTTNIHSIHDKVNPNTPGHDSIRAPTTPIIGEDNDPRALQAGVLDRGMKVEARILRLNRSHSGLRCLSHEMKRRLERCPPSQSDRMPATHTATQAGQNTPW